MTRVLFVCRANRCRSPFAAAIFARATTGSDIEVESAGLLSRGLPMPEAGLALGHEYGFDFAGHRSREFDPFLYDEFDVILTMARDQSRDIVAAYPELLRRVFTIRQFADLLRTHPAPAGVSLAAWLDHGVPARDRVDLLDTVPDDTIVDPFGGGPDVWREMLGQIEPLVSDIVGRLPRSRSTG